jgi:hypothetical protein
MSYGPDRTEPYVRAATYSTRSSKAPDEVGRKLVDMHPYHFVYFPTDANAYDQQRDYKLRNCIIEAIAWYAGAQVAGCTAS